MPGRLTSSTKLPSPRRKRGSSLRFTEWPMPPISGDVFGAIFRTSLAHFLSGVLICFDDVDVACAAAQVARNSVTDFVFSRIVIRVEEGDSSHQHSRSAIAALQAVLLKEAVLQRMQLTVCFETFDRGYRASIRLNGEGCTRFDCAPIHHHRAGAAVARVTTYVRAGQSQVF